MKLTQLFESSKKEVKQRNPVAQELRANPQFKSKTEIDKKKEVKKGYQKHKNKIDESSEYAEVKAILDKHGIKNSEEIEIGTEAYEELFGYYMDSGEMPYGVMKARTGMPDEWIVNRVDDLGLLENIKEDLDDEARNFVDYIQDQGYKILSQGAGPKGISIEYQDREGGVHRVDFKDGKTFKEQDDVPTQKGRDAKHDVLTPRAKNKVLKQIKHDANKDRRSAGKDIERMAKLAGISTASTEATQDLTRQLNPLRGVVGTNTSAQMTAKGLDALSKGERPTPQQVKAVEPYVSSMAKAMQDPKTSAQIRNIIKKVN